MDGYLALLDVEETTRQRCEDVIRIGVRPLLGDLQIGKLDGEMLDSFYTILRRCRAHCDRRPYIEHRKKTHTTRECPVDLGGWMR